MSFPCRSLLGAALAGLFLTGCSSAPQTAVAASGRGASGKSDARKEAPDFALKDANGATVHLSDYKGKVVLLDFWATWCCPCKVEIPWFMEFEQQYKDRGFAVLGVSMDEGGWTEVKPYVEKQKINYRILLGNDQVGEAYGGVDSLPTTFLIDRDGRIASKHEGIEPSNGKDEIRDEIIRLLQAKRSARNRTFVTVPAIIGGAAQ
jgi:peroxiredoxin